MSERSDDQGPRPRVIETEAGPTFAERVAGPRVIGTERTGRIVPVEPAPRALAIVPTCRRRRPLVALGFAALSVFLVGGLALAAVDWVTTLAERSPTLGLLAAAIVASGVTGAALIAWHELKSLFLLRSVETIQRRFCADIPARDTPAAIAALIDVLPRNRDTLAGIETFQRRVQLHHSAAEQVEILSQAVIRPLDARAEAIIRKAALRTFGITALSPTALTDALFFLAVSLRMLREIAETYGLRPTAATTVHLVRRLVREAGRLGAIDLATASLMQHLGAGAAERLSSAAAESLYASQRMGRLGIAIMQLTRPVAFRPEELPNLTSLVGGLLARRSEEARER